MGVHFAAEHALELELAHVRFELDRVAFDFARHALVVLALGEFQQFRRRADGAGGLVHVDEVGGEARAFLAELLRLLRLLPDGGIFELAADFF